MGARLVGTLVNMRRDRASTESVAQLGAQKATGRIAGRTSVKPIGEIAHHRRVLVDDVGENIEIVVVDDDVDFSPQRRKHAFNDAAYLFDVPVVSNHVTFKIDEELVLLWDERVNRCSSGMRKRSSRSPIGSGKKTRSIHERRITADNRLKIHSRQNFALDVDAWSNLDQRQPLRSKFEYTALRHIEHGLVALYCVVAGKGPVFNVTNELVHVSISDDAQTAVFDRNLQSARRKSADEHHLLGILADVDETAGARKTRPEFADIQIALLVRLRETREMPRRARRHHRNRIGRAGR